MFLSPQFNRRPQWGLRSIAVGSSLLLCNLQTSNAHANFIERAVTKSLKPSIDSVIGGARDVAGDLDKSLESRLNQAGGLAKVLVADLDKKVTGQVADLDGRLEARILQVTTSVDSLADRSLGRLDDISRKRIAQVAKAGDRAIASLDSSVARSLKKVDNILDKQMGKIDAILHSAIRETDDVLERRIAQIDTVVENQLGNVDVVATKQRLGLESSLFRLVVGLGVCLFVTFAGWRAWTNFDRIRVLAREKKNSQPLRSFVRNVSLPMLGHTLLGAAVLSGLFLSLDYLPFGARARLAELTASYERGYDASLADFDFPTALHRAAQLKMLDSAPQEASFRVEKVRLFRAVFGRPTALETNEGRAAVREQLRAVSASIAGQQDPDVLSINAYLSWQEARTRKDLYLAASQFGGALRQGQDFVLAPLATSYIRSFLNRPYVPAGISLSRRHESVRSLRRLVRGAPSAKASFPMATVIHLQELVSRLDRNSNAAYLRMLEAQAALQSIWLDAGVRQCPDAASSNRKRRTSRTRRGRIVPPADKLSAAEAKVLAQRNLSAEQVVRAWAHFERELEKDKRLENSFAILSLFSLNDAVVTRALWFVNNPNASCPAGPIGEIPDAGMRAQLAPPRIAWSKRYGHTVGRYAKAILDYQEAVRFMGHERTLLRFEKAYMRASSPPAKTSDEQSSQYWLLAATEAARLGIYTKGPLGQRVPLGWNQIPALHAWMAPIVLSPAVASASASASKSTLTPASALKVGWSVHANLPSSPELELLKTSVESLSLVSL